MGAQSNARRCFTAQLERISALDPCLSRPTIEKYLPHLNKFAFDHLFTVVSLLEWRQTGGSTLDEYRGADLL